MLPTNRARTLAAAGLGCTAAGTSAVVALHVLPPTDQISPIRRTMSENALHETALLFNLRVMAVALGSLAVLAVLAVAGMTRWLSLGGLGLLLWVVGLAAVVYFPKHNWSVGPSLDGHIHRVASLVTFISLPIGALIIAWAWRRDERWRGYALWTATAAAASLACLGVILGAFALQPLTGVRWWRAIPLGAVERSLAAAEIATMFILGWWALKAAAAERPAAAPDTADGPPRIDLSHSNM